jgi:hypothetical protein
MEIEEVANKNREEISRVFNDIRMEIIERETLLKQNTATIDIEHSYYK